MATIVSLALEVGCATAEPNENEELVPMVVVMVDESVFEIEFVVVVTVEVVFMVLKELPSLFPPNIDVFGKVAFVVMEVPPKIFLPASKEKVDVLNMDAVDVGWLNIDCTAVLTVLEVVVCAVSALEGLQILIFSSEVFVVSLLLNCGFMPNEKVVVFLSLNDFKSPMPKLIVELSKMLDVAEDDTNVVGVSVVKENPFFTDVGCVTF